MVHVERRNRAAMRGTFEAETGERANRESLKEEQRPSAGWSSGRLPLDRTTGCRR